MAELKTPGVYVQEIRTLPTSVAPVATAIPAFIGYTQNDVAEPTRIRSMAEFVEIFGGPHASITATIVGSPATSVSLTTTPAALPAHSLYYAMQMYFSNGGGPCWVISTGDYATITAGDFTAALDKLKREDEPTLIVIPEAVQLGSYTVPVAALAQCAELQDRFAILDLLDDNTVSAFRTGIGTQNLKYGAAYYPRIETSLDYPDQAIKIVSTVPAIVALGAGVTLDKVIAAAAAETSPTPISNALNVVLKDIRDLVGALKINLPPSSTIAGIYATVDATRGVWKAPANISLNNVVAPTLKINDDDQEDLNIPNDGMGKSINAIRTFTGKGVMVWGARTLDGNSNEWRYVPVRRLFIMMEESIRKATEFVVFEPNDANTWTLTKGMVNNFLTNIWRQGALAGAKPEDAFFVKVGLGETMTPQDILEGRMIVEIGVAAVRPAEFIVLRFSHKLQES